MTAFDILVQGKVCADLGCSTGGFTDCLLRRGATKVYAVDTGYGVIDWKLRNDERVVVMERTNAMHVELPELVDFLSVDVSWTKQRLVLPHAMTLLKQGGDIVALIKPHYEAEPKERVRGKVKEEALEEILERVEQQIQEIGLTVKGKIESPIVGEKGGNREFLFWLRSN